MKIGIGTTFEYIHADSRPTWKVVSARGADAWNCVVVEADEWAGTTKVFGTEEIRAAIRQTDFWKSLGDENERWWAAAPLGATVHYHNGFKEFVRGVVVEVDGERKMLPTGLVGSWGNHDLPHYTRAGEVREGYHAKKIRKAEPFRPNVSCMVEANPAKWANNDPRPVPAIDLTLPEPTQEQIEAKRLSDILATVQEALSDRWKGEGDYSTALRSRLLAARDVLNAAKL